MEKVKCPKYDFPEDSLVKDFPPYMHKPVKGWIECVFRYGGYYEDEFSNELKQSVINNYQLRLREILPEWGEDFIEHFMADKESAIYLINRLLKEFGNTSTGSGSFGSWLEDILELGGSAYSASTDGKEWGLYYRVSGTAAKNSENARNEDNSLARAWKYCYGVNPDYNKVVIESINSIEGALRDSYFPKDQKPQIGKLIKQIKDNDIDMAFSGSETLDDHGREALGLIKNLSKYRGEHKNGTGRDATREIAIYALNTAIWFWNLHNQK